MNIHKKLKPNFRGFQNSKKEKYKIYPKLLTFFLISDITYNIN